MSELITRKITKAELDGFEVGETLNPLPYILVMITDTSQGTEYKGGAYVTNLPVPSAYGCNFRELSAAGAGRTEDMKMNKMLIGNYAELSVNYTAMTSAEMSELLKVLDEEYACLYFLNPLSNHYEMKEFYASEKSIPMYNGKLGLWDKISITFTQRKADSIYANKVEVSPEA